MGKPQSIKIFSFSILFTLIHQPLSAEPAEVGSRGVDSEATALCNATAESNNTSTSYANLQNGFRATGYISTNVCETANLAEDKHPLAGNYTRWVVEPGAIFHYDGQRVYSLEGRGWIARLFSDRVIETSHSLQIEMAAPTVSIPIALASFKYNEEGENGVEYTTNIRNNGLDQTFFRVNSNTTLNVKARAQHSFRTSYTGAVEVLQAVQDAVKLVAPSSTLLTSINAEQLTKTSNAINEIGGSLFDRSFDETVEDGFNLDSWYKNRRIQIIIQLPFEITSHNRNPRSTNGSRLTRNRDPIYLSYWLSLACPRTSMFSTRDLCTQGSSTDPTTGSILAFEMAANKTVQQFINDQQWYKDFLASDDFRDNPAADTDAEEARDATLLRFCRSIANGVFEAGFNDTDTRLIVAAAIDGMPELAPVSDAMSSACGTAEVQMKDGGKRARGVWGLRSFPVLER
ncbi:hypothetical protein [uncultured Erythrobacter sp.]|uniref:hypothetical protein n=1 Tax=uncultured Erythrobacter sp. TaxID=263913 RepID=UPI002636C004|nr:hypothetical protein [uncultured Erythrobacter sp.]